MLHEFSFIKLRGKYDDGFIQVLNIHVSTQRLSHHSLCCVLAVRVSQMLSLATTLCSQESSSLGLPEFPVDNLSPALHVLVRIDKLDLFNCCFYKKEEEEEEAETNH